MLNFSRFNSKKQGDMEVGATIEFFSSRGNTVCFPLSDSQAFDLVIEENNVLKRVQVKTSSGKSPNGNYIVHLETRGGNKSRSTTKHFDKSKVEYVFILTEEGVKYLIPSININAKAGITLGKDYDIYRVFV